MRFIILLTTYINHLLFIISYQYAVVSSPSDKKGGKESSSSSNNTKGFTGGNIIVKNQFRSPAAASAQGFITANTTTTSSEKELNSPNSRMRQQHHPLSPFTSASKHDQVAMLLGLLARNNITMEQLMSMSEDEQKSLLVSLVDANNRGDATFDSCKGHLDLATALKGILDKNNNSKRAKEVTNLSASAIAVKTAKYDMDHHIHNYSNSSNNGGGENGAVGVGVYQEDESNSIDARKNMLEVIKRRSQQQQQQHTSLQHNNNHSNSSSNGGNNGGSSGSHGDGDTTLGGIGGGIHHHDHHHNASSFSSHTIGNGNIATNQVLIAQSEFAKYFKMVKVISYSFIHAYTSSLS